MSETYKLNWDYSPKVEEIWIQAEYRVSSTWENATEAFIDRGTALTIDGYVVSWTFNDIAGNGFVGGTVYPPSSTVYYRFTVYARYANGDIVALNWDADNPGGGRPTMSGYTVATSASDSVQYLTVVFKSQSAYLPIYIGKNWATVWSGNNQLKKISHNDSSLAGTGTSYADDPGGFQGNISFNSGFSSAEQASTDPLKLRITWNRNFNPENYTDWYGGGTTENAYNTSPNSGYIYSSGGNLAGTNSDSIYYTNVIKTNNIISNGTSTFTTDYTNWLAAFPNLNTDYSQEIWLTPTANAGQIAVQTQDYTRRDMYPSATNYNEVTGIPVFGMAECSLASDYTHVLYSSISSWNLIYRPTDNKFYFGGNCPGTTALGFANVTEITPFKKEFISGFPPLNYQSINPTYPRVSGGGLTLKRVEILR